MRARGTIGQVRPALPMQVTGAEIGIGGNDLSCRGAGTPFRADFGRGAGTSVGAERSERANPAPA
jgi:hypothetical protein